jgi:hypothetical protein
MYLTQVRVKNRSETGGSSRPRPVNERNRDFSPIDNGAILICGNYTPPFAYPDLSD